MIKQLLLVDDSEAIHPLVKALLADEPVEVQSATNPLYGLTLAQSIRPDLVLLDVDMPDMDGYEFCRRMKSDANLSTVPVIFFTAQTSTDKKVHGLNLGAVDYIAKPFNASELLARVRGALRTQSMITRLENRSLVDVLTGLGNNRMFETRLRAEISEMARRPKPLVCAYIDLDGFGTIKKNYGEPFGDEILYKAADLMREIFRPEDVSCRMGDDHFAVLMPATSLSEATQLASRFRDKLACASFKFRQAVVPVTCGIGLAAAKDDYDHGVLERAIDALEQSVGRKSNQIWIADPLVATAAKLAA